MKITYSLTKEDLWNIRKSSKSRSKKFKITCLSGIIIFISSVNAAFKFFKSITLSILSVIPIILLYFLVKSPKSKHAYIKSLPDNDNALKERTIEIDPEHISTSTNFQKSSSKWALVNKIEMTDKYIYIFFLKEAGLFIPKRIFNSESEAVQFYNTATIYFENNKKIDIN